MSKLDLLVVTNIYLKLGALCLARYIATGTCRFAVHFSAVSWHAIETVCGRNSWTQNIEGLTNGRMGQTNYLYMHPEDADGTDALGRVSGMAHLSGIPVQIHKAKAPIDPSRWSGIPA